MAGKLIAVANMKGGVGKTTTVVSLAEALAADDTNVAVLVVDLDPQASASACLAGEDLSEKMILEGRTIDAFLEDRLINSEMSNLGSRVHPTVSQTIHCGSQLNISLLPCSSDLWMIERQIICELAEKDLSMKAIEGQIWKLFNQEILSLNTKYDYVIFDCPPGLSPLSESAIRASDLVIVPTVPDFFSVNGLQGFFEFFWTNRKGGLPPPKLPPHVLVTRFQKTVNQHKEYVEKLETDAARKDTKMRLFRTQVPQLADIPSAWNHGCVMNFTKKYGKAKPTLETLVVELKGMLHGN